MKKIILLVVALFCLCALSSCSKDDGIQKSQDLAALITIQHGNISWNGHCVTKGNNDTWICFNNREAYESIIDTYASSDDETLLEFAESLNYQSMLLSFDEDKREELGIYDDFLAAILNVNGEVQIGDYLFKIDYSKDSAYILNLSNSNFMQVDMNYDFFAAIDGDSENPQVQYCNNKQKGREESVKWKVVYQNALVYHSLLAKINKPGMISAHSTPYIFLSVGFSCTYTVNKRNAEQQTIASFYNGGDGKSYSYKPYSAAKGLKQYHFAAEFQWYEHEYDYPLNLRYGEISKNID